MARCSDSALLHGAKGLTADSRSVTPGTVFVAYKGATVDGRSFIPQAVAAGASVILTDTLPPGTVDGHIGQARVVIAPNPRRRLAELAASFYGLQPDWLALVTGTNGKTSTVEFARQIWTFAGLNAASIGTLGISLPSGRQEGSLTTPDPVSLARLLAQMAANGIGFVAIEASSHGLEQERLSGVRANIGVFTSFSRDHLDYHKDERSYLNAKLGLFRERLPAGSAAVIFADGAFSAEAIKVATDHKLDVWTYGRQGERICLQQRIDFQVCQLLTLSVDGLRYDLKLPLSGDFQAENAMAAMAIALASGVKVETAIAALQRLKTVDGRLQLAARREDGATVYVDYAHTPGALEAALTALRPATKGRLLVLFGAGGDRDRGKRPEMGRVAARLADACIVTDDNPRSEKAAEIRAEVLSGCSGAIEIGSRHEAIAYAVSALRPGDTLLVAGKGHERGQTIAGKVYPFDDLAEVQTAMGVAETCA